MFHKMTCPSCGKRFAFDEAKCGKTGKCPHCKNRCELIAATPTSNVSRSAIEKQLDPTVAKPNDTPPAAPDWVSWATLGYFSSTTSAPAPNASPTIESDPEEFADMFTKAIQEQSAPIVPYRPKPGPASKPPEVVIDVVARPRQESKADDRSWMAKFTRDMMESVGLADSPEEHRRKQEHAEKLRVEAMARGYVFLGIMTAIGLAIYADFRLGGLTGQQAGGVMCIAYFVCATTLRPWQIPWYVWLFATLFTFMLFSALLTAIAAPKIVVPVR